MSVKKRGYIVAFFALILVFSVQGVRADSLFYDGFSSTNPLSTGWNGSYVETPNSMNLTNDIFTDNVIPHNGYYMVTKDGAAASISVNTLGYENIGLDYWRGSWASTSDSLMVEWRVGNSGNWNLIELSQFINVWASNSFNFPSSADNQAEIQLRFWLNDSNLESEPVAAWDEIVVTGDISDVGVPMCSVDSIEHRDTNNVYNFNSSIYVNELGNYYVKGDSWDLYSPIDNVQYNRTSPNINFVWTDADPIDGSFNSLQEPWQSDPNDQSFVNGWHNVCCRAVDDPGNTGDGSCQAFCIDTLNPEKVMNVVHSNPSACVSNYVNQAPSFGWDLGMDNGCSGINNYEVEVYYSNGSYYYSTFVSNNSLDVLNPTNGDDYYIRVRAVDNAGNVGTWSNNSGHVYFDNEDPNVNIIGEDPGVWYNDDFDVIEVDYDNLGLYSCEYRIWNEGNFTLDWTPTVCNQNITIDVSTYCPVDGLNNCRVYKRVTDFACNQASTSRQWDLDRVNPITTKIISDHKYPGGLYCPGNESIGESYSGEGNLGFVNLGNGNSGNGVLESGGFNVGDLVFQLNASDLPVPGHTAYCSIGLAFDGSSLYYNRCDDTNIYEIDPLSGALQNTFDTNLFSSHPNAMAFDSTRNGIWFGAQDCKIVNSTNHMPIYFWNFTDDSVNEEFSVSESLINPATGDDFLGFCFLDGLAFNAGADVNNSGDDELWFSDDINENLGVFRPDGTFVSGFDATTINSSLSTLSGLAIGGANLYLGNNGGGDVFRADSSTLALIDQFTSQDERLEDMACDPNTFANLGAEVMWVRHTPQGNADDDLISAFYIESNTCGFGGVLTNSTPVNPPAPSGCVEVDWFVTDETNFTFTCDDGNLSGCYETQYRTMFENNAWSSWNVFNGSFNLNEGDGVYKMEYYSTDIAGNIEDVQNETDKVDTIAPVTTKEIGQPQYLDGLGNLWVSGLTNFTLSCSDSEVGCNQTCYDVQSAGLGEISNICVQQSPVVFNLNGYENGALNISYWSQDQLWNTEEINYQTDWLDTIPPTIQVLNPTVQEALDVRRCVQSVVANVQDSGSGLQSVWSELIDSNGTVVRTEVMSETSAPGVYETLMDKQLPAGNYTLKVYANDNLNNVQVVNVLEILPEDVFVEYLSDPATGGAVACEINLNSGGTCDLRLHVCMRGADSVRMWMDKFGNIVTPFMMNATIFKNNESNYVGLMQNGVNVTEAGLLDLQEGVINGRTNFDLGLNIDSNIAQQIGPGEHTLEYLLRSYLTI
jgi:hypothetical protein